MIKKFIVAKLLALTLVGTAWAATPCKVEVFATAVARAEGFFAPGSLPNRYHNPGDLKARNGEHYPGQVKVGKAGHIVFKNDAAGWAALNHQIQKIADGESRIYHLDMTLRDVSRHYAGDSRLWVKNVSHNLGVSPETTLNEFFTGASDDCDFRVDVL